MQASPDQDNLRSVSPSPAQRYSAETHPPINTPPLGTNSPSLPQDPNELQARLCKILIQISGANPDQITPEARLIEDIGIDSLGFYEILIEADQCLGIKIREEDLLKFRTVGDIQNHLRSLERPDATAT